ncbi:SdpA family antimicrobial peptide system protein [Streptomyces sp. NPDC047046]|uniref:SdpA family antimicrobial peptide system protein n=1 Tax=Streptomyces sp. NPDC047046 TaxID=3155378 RepID=UPI0033D67014
MNPSTGGDGRTDKEVQAGSTRPLILFVLVCVCVFGYLALGLFYTLPSNALSSRHSAGARTAFNTLVPQNWAFFTRNPETGQTGAYRLGHDGEVSDLLHTPQGAPSNLFGLSRTQRAQGPELGYLNAHVTGHYAKCSAYLADCVEESAKRAPVKVTNTSPLPTLCGDLVLTQEKTVPWAFRNEVPYQKHVDRVAHVDVRCH